MNINSKIKYYREKMQMSKSELARKIGVSPSYITMLENGSKSNPSLEILTKIAIALNISLKELDEEQYSKNIAELFASGSLLDVAREQIEENSKRNDIEYNQLYDDIETLFEKYDYILESDDNCNSIDEELITIIKDEEDILTIRKSVLISSGESILKLINEFNEFAIQKLINELKNK